VSRGNRSRKLDITVGQFLAVLLWLLVPAASETSRVFSANFAFSAVASSPAGIDRVPTAVSKHLFHYRKEHIERREIFYATFALPSLKVCAACANFSGSRLSGIHHSTKDFLTTKVAKDTKIL
jgi:hypothetical protein